jgi:hypothetical protein
MLELDLGDTNGRVGTHLDVVSIHFCKTQKWCGEEEVRERAML